MEFVAIALDFVWIAWLAVWFAGYLFAYLLVGLFDLWVFGVWGFGRLVLVYLLFTCFGFGSLLRVLLFLFM